jgi:glycosyltransferase involved in cell wall biosynthesis
MDKKRIVFLYPFLLHYHLPRIFLLDQECQKSGFRLYNIVLRQYDESYHQFIEKDVDSNAQFIKFLCASNDRTSVNSLWSALNKTLTELQPDVIFIYGYSERIFRQAFFWAKARKIATVLVSDSNFFDKRRNSILEYIKKIIVSRFDAAFVAGTSASLYIQSLGIPLERIVQGFDAVDNSFFSARALENKGCISELRQKWNLPEDFFLFVGRFIKEKNLRSLFAAYQQYLERNHDESHLWKLVLCGSGPEEDLTNKYIQNLPNPVQDNISLYGMIKQPEIIDFYSCAACFILPSVSETWGLVVNEAMVCGLPVLVSENVGCALDLVMENYNGWCFDPYDIGKLANLMNHISKLDDPVRIGMGLNGTKIISNWGLERFSEGVLESVEIAIKHNSC